MVIMSEYTGIYSDNPTWNGQWKGWVTSRLVSSLYDAAETDESRIQMMCEAIYRLHKVQEGFLSIDAFNAWLEKYTVEQEEQDRKNKLYTDTEIAKLRDELLRIIEEISTGNILVTDPSSGKIKPINDALSHLYNDLRYYAATWDEIDAVTSQYTYDEWDAITAQYTVKQFDILFAFIFGITTVPRALTLPQD